MARKKTKPQLRLACFSDETGQDTAGRFFLVATCIVDLDKVDSYNNILTEVESATNKKSIKWGKCSNKIRTDFIEGLNESSFPLKSLFYSDFKDTKQYAQLISLVIAKTILQKTDDKEYVVKIYFDKITRRTELVVKQELKKLKIKFRSVRGVRDESVALIRLVDSIAGFMRDSIEDRQYSKHLRFFTNKVIKI